MHYFALPVTFIVPLLKSWFLLRLLFESRVFLKNAAIIVKETRFIYDDY